MLGLNIRWEIIFLKTLGDASTVELSTLKFLVDGSVINPWAGDGTEYGTGRISGDFASLGDSDPATTVVWSHPGAKASTVVQCYLPDVILAGPTRETFPSVIQVGYTDAYSVWHPYKTIWGIQWPGANVPVTAANGPVRLMGKFGHLTAATSSLPDLLPVPLGKCIGRVRGTITVKGVPASRRVRLVREKDGLTVREVWSDPTTGAYAFNRVDELQTYTVLAYDHTNTWPAEVAGGRSLGNGGVELMP